MLNIQQKIEKKNQEIKDHQDKIQKAQAYIEVLKDLDDEISFKPPRAQHKFPRRKGNRTNIEKAAEIILKAGRPLHANEVVKALGWRRTLRNKVSIASSMAHYSNADKIFKRVAPNTFDVLRGNTRH